MSGSVWSESKVPATTRSSRLTVPKRGAAPQRRSSVPNDTFDEARIASARVTSVLGA